MGTGLAETPGGGLLFQIWGPSEAGSHEWIWFAPAAPSGPEAADGRLTPGVAHLMAPRAQVGRQGGQ